ncbi:MAG: AAA family ATPase [Candidatus Nomurabacteria bacterium]|nr:AAA family ATPase [Candidatus Nomurabacteria bacterium]
MLLKKLELNGFKSFAKKSEFLFDAPITSIVGPNGSGKSNVVEAIRFVLGEQSSKSLRSKSGADLVYAGSEKTPKMNRASVAITFDNSKRVFKLDNAKNEKVSIDFDEITLSREVFSDGTNNYKINKHEVRLKDIHEIIAGINIGSSGHHIISQGEADRLLNANARDRREMIEEALGLKLYHYRIRESEKKMEKTSDNLREAELSRREIAPHLKFLAKQVEKGKQAQEMQDELMNLYLVYLKSQELLLNTSAHNLAQKKSETEKNLESNEKIMLDLRSKLSGTGDNPHANDIVQTEKELRFISNTKQDISHKRGRIEGMIEFAKRQTGSQKTAAISVAIDEIKHLSQSIDSIINDALADGTVTVSQNALNEIKTMMSGFVAAHNKNNEPKPVQTDTSDLESELTAITGQLGSLEDQESKLREQLTDLQAQVAQAQSAGQGAEDALIATSESIATARANIARVDEQLQDLGRQKELFFEDKEEGKAIVGSALDAYKNADISTDSVTEQSQRELRTKLERTKIKLEELGGGVNQDIIDEHEQTKTRDEFLAREIEDLSQSAQKLSDIIESLKAELHKEFAGGITKINTEFQNFFQTMFGGGKAKLSIVDIISRRRNDEAEEHEVEQGIDIAVSLPRKKITDIDMLSGGERSLTSIALLFALSQVNPPPFLVLDETDAALDEANSQKYSSMIKQLSAFSQLIVVTHNRETMSCADILYGVTLGREGYSKLLSVKFDEAQQYAK